jgi:hypothetical protein
MKTEKRIVFACFTGAALGAVVAMQLHYFWWLGILVGGATGYLSFSFREVMAAAVTAWNTLSGGGLKGHALKTGLVNAARFLAILGCVIVGAVSAFILLIGVIMLCTATPEVTSRWHAVPAASARMPIPRVFWLSAAAGVLVLGSALFVWILRLPDRKRTWTAMVGCVAATPLVLPLTLAFVFLSVIVPPGIRFMGRLARQTFILVHSEVRLLCLTDALLGALIGYLFANALIGGLAGAALGWLNYRFISVRWLKLAKA